MAERRAWASPEQLSDWLDLGPQGTRKLRKMRKDGTGPLFITVGREIRYAWVDVHAWCAARRDRG